VSILVDGDIIAYRAAYSTEGEEPSVAKEKVDELMDDIAFNTTTRDEDLEVFLTGKGNFRYTLSPTYKANRKDTPRPEHLGLVRDYLVDAWDAVVSSGQEADDLIAIRATELNYKCVIVSTDKDFKQVPCRHYNPNKGLWLTVSEFEGTKFFYSQILTGDTADNIAGIRGVGPVKASRILSGCTTEQELYDKVLEAYDNDEVLVLTNARLLWLRRKEEDVWLPPSLR
jgi:5'-3' exonuclease